MNSESSTPERNVDLIASVHTSVLNSEITAKALADDIGKSYSTLMREINPRDDGAKLGAETLQEIMRHTRDITPLRLMAESLGYTVKPVRSTRKM